MQIILQNQEKFVHQAPMIIPDNAQPVMADINGDLKQEILVNELDSINVYNYTDTLVLDSPLNNYASSSQDCLAYDGILLSYPHSVGFVDLNKDCLADLFLTVYHQDVLTFEIWLNAMDGQYCKVLSTSAPPGTQQVSFADIDRNGIEDIIFPVCKGTNCADGQEIHIVFNDNKESEDCNFSGVSEKTFNLGDLGSTVATENKLIVNITSAFYSHGPEFPITLRFGDFNLDGYPDALITLYNATEGPKSAYVEYLSNVQCSYCGKHERTLERSGSSDLNLLRSIKGAVLGCFFDLDDNGILDIIVESYNGSDYQVTSFYNNFLNDAFHLKALALDGYSRGGYSSGFPGAVFMFTLTELDMSKVVMHSTQMPLTGFYALNTPYCVYGLGRTNSYIEEFYVAMPIKKNNHKSWTPIIPNSYLIASPNINSLDEWYLELFASPTDKIGIIIVVCVGCMTFIGVIVVYNYYREKREDKKMFGVRF